MTRLSRLFVLVPATLMATPALAQQKGLTFGTVFNDAALSMKLLMLLLIASVIVSIVIAVRKIIAGPALVGGSAFLSGLRLGGPLIGLLGAAFNGVHMFMGISNSPEPVPFNVLAPGFAEATTIAMLGLLAGVVAVVCNWAVESRIDRAVLRP